MIQSLQRGIRRRVKHWSDWMTSPDYRYRFRETGRLDSMPRYTQGTTQLFGHTIEFIDACTYLAMVDELFERGVYQFTAKTERPLIIDGGANIGLSVLFFKRLYPDSRIIAFEADPAIFPVLQRNCGACALQNVQLVNKALWISDTTLPFRQEGSLAGRIDTNVAAQTVSIPTCRLSEFLNEPVDLLKLDIEGAETEVLKECADRLGNVTNLFVEHHSFQHQPQNLHVLIDLLHTAGFRLFVEPATAASQPLVARKIICGMDVQLNIFGFRE